MKKIIYLIIVLTISCNYQEKDSNSLQHHFGEFSDSMETIRKNLEGRCSKIEERGLRIILSTAKKQQARLECHDLLYRRKGL